MRQKRAFVLEPGRMFVKLAVTATLRLGKFCPKVLWPASSNADKSEQQAGSLVMWRLLKWLVGATGLILVVVATAFAWFVWWPAHSVPDPEPVQNYVWLD